MIVTATEFKTNFGKYLEMIAKEDIFITRNGKTIAKVVNPQVSAVDSLQGIPHIFQHSFYYFRHIGILLYKIVSCSTSFLHIFCA